MSFPLVVKKSIRFVAKTKTIQPPLQANDILCLFEAHGGSKDSILGEARRHGSMFEFSGWLMLPKGVVEFIG